jgi:hypothetical protein
LWFFKKIKYLYIEFFVTLILYLIFIFLLKFIILYSEKFLLRFLLIPIFIGQHKICVKFYGVNKHLIVK